jgi:hypothetical protein
MAKEKFIRNKPHVNIGTLDFGAIVTDSFGQLSYHDDADSSDAGRAPSMLVGFDAPGSSNLESAVVAFPIDSDFLFDPATNGPAISIDVDLEVLPQNILGTTQIDVSLAIIQGETFIATAGVQSLDGTETDWTTLVQRGLTANDFQAADGGPERPDFSQSFKFGYSFSGEYSSTALDVDLLLDNMTVEITTVPEPTTIGLALSLGAVFVWHRWFRTED